jgi:2,3-bisphosphoglycerate-dependent phosphoglycerate mutase
LIIFVLRHADRQPAPDDDLTSAGQERAELLARMLSGSGISTAYHSGAVRARRTLEPLKQKLGDALTVEAIGSGDVQRTVAAVKSRSIGDIIAAVGHSDTVGPIIEGLSGESIGLIGPNEFDKLFVLFIDPTDKATLLRLRYGTAT